MTIFLQPKNQKQPTTKPRKGNRAPTSDMRQPFWRTTSLTHQVGTNKPLLILWFSVFMSAKSLDSQQNAYKHIKYMFIEFLPKSKFTTQLYFTRSIKDGSFRQSRRHFCHYCTDISLPCPINLELLIWMRNWKGWEWGIEINSRNIPFHSSAQNTLNQNTGQY